MNSYELLRPDGTGTGIWSCGECHKPHLVARQANLPPTATDASQKNAALRATVGTVGKSPTGIGAVSFAGSTKSVSPGTSRCRRIHQ